MKHGVVPPSPRGVRSRVRPKRRSVVPPRRPPHYHASRRRLVGRSSVHKKTCSLRPRRNSRDGAMGHRTASERRQVSPRPPAQPYQTPQGPRNASGVPPAHAVWTPFVKMDPQNAASSRDVQLPEQPHLPRNNYVRRIEFRCAKDITLTTRSRIRQCCSSRSLRKPGAQSPR